MMHGTSTGLLTAVRSGFGIAVLAVRRRRCRPGPDPLPSAARGPLAVCCGWSPTNASAARPRVRAVIDFLYERLMRHVRQLEEKQAAA